MMEEFFEDPRARERARTSPAGAHLDGFADWLREDGYAARSIREFLRTAVHLGLWLGRKDTPLTALDESWIERFRRHLSRCSCPGPHPRRKRNHKIAKRAARFLRYLRDRGIVCEAVPPPAREIHPLLAGFEAWMRQHRGVTETTLRIYGRILTDALHTLGDDPAAFDAGGVHEFVLERSRAHGRSKAKLVMTAMRGFLRYLVAQGACQPGLEGAVPTIAGWRLASLPRYLSSSDVDRLIATCDPTTTSGARNRAILLLLARLGLRAGDVAALRLGDFDWCCATLAVSGKSRRATRLPLPQEVGDAVLAYLPLRVPKDCTDRVFLRLSPPRGAIQSGTVTCVVKRAMSVAGIVAPTRGAHVLRHSLAAELLRQGASLDQLQVILRHRNPETTRLYAKVDVASLRRIAQPWPEVTPC